jgi:hypothetical protein
MNKRNLMNLVLLGGISLPVGAMGLPFLSFFVPPSCVLGDLLIHVTTWELWGLWGRAGVCRLLGP